MSLETLDTKHFGEVELSAESIANTIRDLKADIAKSKRLAERSWVGEGRTQYDNLSYVVDQQIQDVSDEFWDVYESLIEAQETYLEADHELSTAIASGEKVS